MSPKVRPATPEDVAHIASWTIDTFEWGDYIAERLPEWLNDSTAHVVVSVNRDDRPIGVANTRMISPGEAWLEGARVHPDHRRSGIGSAMNRAGTDWARSQGARVARLATEGTNEAPQHQALAIGYRLASTWSVARLESRRPRLDDDRRLRPSPSADIDPAWMLWSVGDLAAAGKELISHGWRWRTARRGDLEAANLAGTLFQCPSGWAIVEQPAPDTLRTGWLTTTMEDAPHLLDALVDLGGSFGVETVRVFVPAVPWMVETLLRAGAEPREATIYSLTL